MVGVQGIEPCTSWSQTKHATGAPHPETENQILKVKPTPDKLSTKTTLRLNKRLD